MKSNLPRIIFSFSWLVLFIYFSSWITIFDIYNGIPKENALNIFLEAPFYLIDKIWTFQRFMVEFVAIGIIGFLFGWVVYNSFKRIGG